MTDEPELQNQAEGNAPPDAEARFSVIRVVVLIIVAVAVFWFGSTAYYASLDAAPRLVPASGQVIWNDEPVTIGGVATVLVNDPLTGSVGVLDAEGRFELMTNGESGAPVGEHKLQVASFGTGMPPPPLVPAEYADMVNTPLRIHVTSDPEQNQFLIELTGDAPAPPARPEGQPRRPGGGDERVPEEGDGRVPEEGDGARTDSDESLSQEEE